MGAVCAVISRYFALWVLLAAVAGWYAPDAFTWVGPQIPLLLGVIMFGMGMTLRLDDFRALLIRPWEVLGGVAAQYTIMPLLALLVVSVFRLPPDLAVGVILLGTCPGGTASNVMTFLARGDVALSVAITSVSTLLAPFLTPVLTLWLAGAYVDVALGALFVSIVKIVILPLALGLIAHRVLGARVAPFMRALPVVSIVAIALIVAFVIGANAERIRSVTGAIVGAVVAHNLLGLAVGYLAALLFRMPLAKRKAVCLEVGMQNSGLAVALATLHFNPLAAVPGAMFSLWHNLSGPLLATYWTWREDRDAAAKTADEPA
jgi:BASS family bile acid:Na+ symporter